MDTKKLVLAVAMTWMGCAQAPAEADSATTNALRNDDRSFTLSLAGKWGLLEMRGRTTVSMDDDDDERAARGLPAIERPYSSTRVFSNGRLVTRRAALDRTACELSGRPRGNVGHSAIRFELGGSMLSGRDAAGDRWTLWCFRESAPDQDGRSSGAVGVSIADLATASRVFGAYMTTSTATEAEEPEEPEGEDDVE